MIDDWTCIDINMPEEGAIWSQCSVVLECKFDPNQSDIATLVFMESKLSMAEFPFPCDTLGLVVNRAFLEPCFDKKFTHGCPDPLNEKIDSNKNFIKVNHYAVTEFPQKKVMVKTWLFVYPCMEMPLEKSMSKQMKRQDHALMYVFWRDVLP